MSQFERERNAYDVMVSFLHAAIAARDAFVNANLPMPRRLAMVFLDDRVLPPAPGIDPDADRPMPARTLADETGTRTDRGPIGVGPLTGQVEQRREPCIHQEARKPEEAQARTDEHDDHDDDQGEEWDDLQPEKLDPIAKRKSRGGLVSWRSERILLILNQLGPMLMCDIQRHLEASACQTRYAAQKGCIVIDGNLYAAGRISKLWNADDEAMFGKPKISVGIPWGKESEETIEPPRELAAIGEDADEEQDEDPAEQDNEPPVIEERSERWLRSEKHPELTKCDLCDSKFNRELICIAKDYNGEVVMCRPCARRAGHNPPAAKNHKPFSRVTIE